MPKGLFIMLEGTDGAGKSTQTELLVNQLKKDGYRVGQISFPQYGQRSAAMVEDYLNGEFGVAKQVGPYCASLFYAIDRYAAKEKINHWLKQGKIVIANRYVASNLAHQGGKILNDRQREKYFAWDYDLEYKILGLPKPDINIILHVTPKISQQLIDKKGAREYLKGKKRDIHENDLKHLKQAEQTYLQLADLYSEFTVIECVKNNKILPIKEIQTKIWRLIKKHLD